MRAVVVECLECGLPRVVRGSTLHALGAGHCPRCDYVGWASSDRLSEDERRALRDVPVAARGRRPAAAGFPH